MNFNWIPLNGAEDLYDHFCVDMTEFAADRPIPDMCLENGNNCGSCAGA